jgi:tetratricopeptide (TPR) repeat protein
VCICVKWKTDILAGQSLEYSGDLKQATEILCHLREDIPFTEYGWIASLDNALANIYIRRGEWRLALGSLDRIIDLTPEVVRAEVRSFLTSNGSNTSSIDAESEDIATSFLTKAYVCEILSRQGRIFLQVGALSEAREVFDAAKTMWTDNIESSTSLSSIPLSEAISNRNKTLRVVMQSLFEINDGLFHFSKSDYDEALHSFSNAIDIFRKDGSSFHSQYRAQDWAGPAIAGCQGSSLVYNEAVNNTSLCNLYMCNMKEAIFALEALVKEDPTAFLTERVAFNLCTLYELGSDSAVATRKKRVLQLIAKRFFLHDIGPESFRVT